jgi:trimeric autotransporter adhesin
MGMRAPAVIFSATIYKRHLWIAAIRGFPEGFSNMLSSTKKIQIVGAFATLLLFALGVGCNGFFVDPVLTSIAVGPTATIQQGATVQESAIGTYNDGSTKSLGSGVQWSSSDVTAASVSNSGLVTGNAQGSATITAAFQATSGTSSITVNLGNVTALKISPAGNTNIHASGGSAPFIALATVTGESNPVDVSGSGTTWTLSNTTDFQLTQGDPVTVTTITANVGATSQLSASYASTTTVNAIPVTLTMIP